ncbi:protocatechuate 3,4-dioxygenase beta subunit [Corynespora cassiicola Philippines]|uniref:Protocatechuate 3,4-dioxygenase beta subunit n=1 Tax=Corynespora cassiicola Philippines TaxID=1448308 RepID=A0A2T2N1Q5_CORCC|nr:protocatechuate 3,4-dioxygenase beta subunit [Corynespora cassiicola Philippines]
MHRHFFIALLFAFTPAAHPNAPPTARQLAEHQSISKRCAASAGAFTLERKKRSLAKRNAHLLPRDSNVTIHTEGPHYSKIQNETCILVPEVTEGPYYWPRSDTLRQDMREDQAGVLLYLDIGILDINTCEPAPNVLVDLWHCNATGSYSSFEAISPDIPFGDILEQSNSTWTGGSFQDLDLHSENSTWLRGMWPTDNNGVMEMTTIFPGYYIQRTVHIHLRAFKDWVVRNNGTVASSNVVHTGQIYFDEALSSSIMEMEPYSTPREIERTTNDVDNVFLGQVDAGRGWIPTIQVEPLDGVDITNGMIGYITLGVDMKANSTAHPSSPIGAVPSGIRSIN